VSNILQLERGVDGLFDSFARLDSRISSVGQTAAKIGDHLQVSEWCWLLSLPSLSSSMPYGFRSLISLSLLVFS